MDQIKEILVGTNNEGKYREICDLLPKEVKKYSPKEFKYCYSKRNWRKLHRKFNS